MSGKSPELSLEMSATTFVPKTISHFLDELSMIHDFSEKLANVNDYVRALEDELKKIDAFKRELPLCMLLLNDAIDRMKEEIMQCKGAEIVPVMEEFLPLKSNFEEEGGVKMSTDNGDKKNWMSSAQLWSTPVQYDSDIKKHNSSLDPKPRNVDTMEDGCADVSERPYQPCNLGNRVGAFLPFKKQMRREMNRGGTPMTETGLVSLSLKGSFGSSESVKAVQQSRKQRRCWSPDLHLRFVNALQQLGGAQVATPKQIRELMRVDGLTNDEVKSHLQKYRLHVRKLPASSTAAPSNGFWKNIASVQNQCNEGVLKAQSGSPEGPLQLPQSARGVSFTCGDSISMEDDDEEKSESNSWKGQRLDKAAKDHVQPHSPRFLQI